MSLQLRDGDTQPVTFTAAPVLDAAGNPDTSAKVAFHTDKADAFAIHDNGDGTATGTVTHNVVPPLTVNVWTTAVDADGHESEPGPRFSIDIVAGDATTGPAVNVSANPNATAPAPATPAAGNVPTRTTDASTPAAPAAAAGATAAETATAASSAATEAAAATPQTPEGTSSEAAQEAAGTTTPTPATTVTPAQAPDPTATAAPAAAPTPASGTPTPPAGT